MTASPDEVAASYAFCRRMGRKARSSFYPCFFLLSGPKRRAMEAIYAYMRHTDDLADSEGPLDVRRADVQRWRRAVVDSLAGEPCDKGDPQQTLLPALADTVRRFGIPTEHLLAVLDGVEMDLDNRRYETFEDLAGYCRRVASSVGLACVHVWGYRTAAAFPLADRCGLAFQMTNILRDLGEDAARGRLYLPLEDLRCAGCSPEDLARGAASDGFDRLIDLEAERVRRLYREGADLFDALEADGRRIFGMMTDLYHRLFEAVVARRREIFSRRVGLSGRSKVAVAARWLLFPPRRSALPRLP